MAKISVKTEKQQQQPVIKPNKILSTNCRRQKALTKWRHRDVNKDKTNRKWRHEPPCLTSCNSPAFLYEKFFDDSTYEVIYEESIRHAVPHGRHDFKMLIDEAKNWFHCFYIIVMFHF